MVILRWYLSSVWGREKHWLGNGGGMRRLNRRESQLPGDKGIHLSRATEPTRGKYPAFAVFRLINSVPVWNWFLQSKTKYILRARRLKPGFPNNKLCFRVVMFKQPWLTSTVAVELWKIMRVKVYNRRIRWCKRYGAEEDNICKGGLVGGGKRKWNKWKENRGEEEECWEV